MLVRDATEKISIPRQFQDISTTYPCYLFSCLEFIARSPVPVGSRVTFIAGPKKVNKGTTSLRRAWEPMA